MNTSNHLLVGTGIAIAVNQPLLALPLAFGSHFVLDALPHYGYGRKGYGELFKHKLFYFSLLLDLIGVVLLLTNFNYSELILVACAILALSPDFEWPYHYYWFERKGLKPPATRLSKFHNYVQWCEKPWGIVVEVVFFVVLYMLITSV